MRILVEVILWFGFGVSLGAIFIFIKCLGRLMESKEEQLSNERERTFEAIHQGATLNKILEELKGGLKNGKKNRNTRR